MIQSIYQGGLGNQLFQIATGYALARDNDDEYYMNVNLHLGKGQGHHIKEYSSSIFKNIPETNIVYDNLYKEPLFSHTPIQYSKNLKLDGYFQSEKYFPQYKNQLNKLFGFDAPQYYTGLCGIQIRTGDYLYSPNFNIVTPQYVKNAMDIVKSQHPSIKFLVITDDKELAQRYLPQSEIYDYASNYHTDQDVDSVKSVNDLHMMSRCDFCIMSNSTYGWWGSYLGKSKTTIVPDRWFNNDFNTSDVYRSDMIKISV